MSKSGKKRKSQRAGRRDLDFSAIRERKRKEKRRWRILVLIGFFAFLIVCVALSQFSVPQSSSNLISSKVVDVALNGTATEAFNFAGESVDVEMSEDCYVPVTFTLEAMEVDRPGLVDIYINEFYIGSSQIIETGICWIQSGCGCSTTCVCEIPTGNNVVSFVSQGFSGKVKYEVRLKT